MFPGLWTVGKIVFRKLAQPGRSFRRRFFQSCQSLINLDEQDLYRLILYTPLILVF